jgi:hypothetical protein
MDFDFTSEQTQLKDSVDRFVAGQYGSLEARERMRKLPAAMTRKFGPAMRNSVFWAYPLRMRTAASAVGQWKR